MRLLPPPQSLFSDTGRPNYGIYRGQMSALDELKNQGNIFQKLRQKRWLWCGLFHEKFFLSIGIVDLSYVGQTFVFFADLQSSFNKIIEVLSPLSRGIELQGLFTNLAASSNINDTHVAIETVDSIVEVVVNSKAIDVHVQVELSSSTPASVLSSLGQPDGEHLGATIKCAGLKAKGEIIIDKKSMLTKGEPLFAALDWTSGIFPYHTRWNWTCSSGIASDGTRIGINLGCGVHDDSKRGLNENVAWIDGEPFQLPSVHFELSLSGNKKVWKIESEKPGDVQLEFSPLGARQANTDFGIVASSLEQGYGTISGIIHTNDRKIILANQPAVLEQHKARW